MLKLQAKGSQPAESVNVLEFELDDQAGGEVFLNEVGTGWAILGLRVVEGKVTFFRCRNIEDEQFLTDKRGRLEEVDE